MSDPQEPPDDSDRLETEVVDSADDVVLLIKVRRVPTIVQCPRHQVPELKNGWSVDVTPTEKYADESQVGDGMILLEAILGATQRMLWQCHLEGLVFAIEGEVPPEKVRAVIGTTENAAPGSQPIH